MTVDSRSLQPALETAPHNARPPPPAAHPPLPPSASHYPVLHSPVVGGSHSYVLGGNGGNGGNGGARFGGNGGGGGAGGGVAALEAALGGPQLSQAPASRPRATVASAAEERRKRQLDAAARGSPGSMRSLREHEQARLQAIQFGEVRRGSFRRLCERCARVCVLRARCVFGRVVRFCARVLRVCARGASFEPSYTLVSLSSRLSRAPLGASFGASSPIRLSASRVCVCVFGRCSAFCHSCRCTSSSA